MSEIISVEKHNKVKKDKKNKKRKGDSEEEESENENTGVRWSRNPRN